MILYFTLPVPTPTSLICDETHRHLQSPKTLRCAIGTISTIISSFIHQIPHVLLAIIGA